MVEARSGATRRGEGERPWARRYPPIASMALALVLVMAVLPSALNTPQSNPTTTPEYAPVPPSDNAAAPPGGNVSSFGLAGSSSLKQGSAQQAANASDVPAQGAGNLAARGKTPSTKRCVGNPPRQTEDEVSPPCVADFRGDNGGATYGGVTRDEIRVLIYTLGSLYNTGDAGIQSSPKNAYVDVGAAADPNEHVVARLARGYQQYFNDRYQTYGRFVHFFVYFNDASVGDAASRRADAADNFATVHPFAVITALISGGNEEPYLEEMSKRGVLSFGSFSGRSQSLFDSFPAKVWGYFPSVEQMAARFTAYLCKKVIPYAASFSGNPLDNGSPRRLGLLYTSDTGRPPGLREAVKAGIAKCGGTFLDEEALPYAVDTTGNENAQASATAVATFQQKRISTVVWITGFDASFTRAAGSTAYRPELVVLGDGQTDGSYANGINQDQSVWQHAWVVSAETYFTTISAEPCYQAYREVDASENSTNIYWYACSLTYQSLRQMFTGIQVAGPRLTPASVDQGFHAIPALASTNPRVPACFYEPGDYTCVKDSVAEWWNTAGNKSGGCWMMTEGGRRRIGEDWPDGDVLTMKGPNDFCNNYSAVF
jgi:hypothetical protein